MDQVDNKSVESGFPCLDYCMVMWTQETREPWEFRSRLVVRERLHAVTIVPNRRWHTH